MSEPTIDEMLLWLSRREKEWSLTGEPKAIRAILESHRALPTVTAMLMQETQLEAIRAFVERVEKRIDNALPFTELADLMREELAAMEKENDAT